VGQLAQLGVAALDLLERLGKQPRRSVAVLA